MNKVQACYRYMPFWLLFLAVMRFVTLFLFTKNILFADSKVYITNYTCTNGPALETRGRHSFYSGHVALSICGAVFAALYIYERWPRDGVWIFVKAFVSFLILLQVAFIAMTRITDNMHFSSDVLTGLLIGSLTAFLSVSIMNKLLV